MDRESEIRLLNWDYGIRWPCPTQAPHFTHQVKDGENRRDTLDVAGCRSVCRET